MKPANQSVVKAVLYRGIGQKPCFCEEVNVPGPTITDEYSRYSAPINCNPYAPKVEASTADYTATEITS